MGRPGRPPKWSDDLRRKAVARLMAGETLIAVSAELGIPRGTLQLWRSSLEPEVRRAIVPLPLTGPPTLEERAPVLAERVLEEIAHIAFGNLSDVVSWDESGNITYLPSWELSPAQAAIVSEVRVKRSRRAGSGDDAWEVEEATIKVRDKLGALRELAKVSGLIQAPLVEINDNRDQRTQVVAGKLDQLDVEELRQLAEGLRGDNGE